MPRLPRLSLMLLAGLWSGVSARAQQSELRTLANSLAQDIATAGKKTIAVVDFVDLQGNSSELGKFLAEEFSVALTRTHKGFEVVERNHLKAILAEHKLTSTGLIDPATAKKLGEFSGADAIVTGSMTPFAEHVRVAVKVLATDTARIIAADDTDLPKTQTIAELLGSSMSRGNQGGRGSDRPPAGKQPSGQPNSGPPPSSPVVVALQFQYELIDCKGMGNSVTCSFRITNRGLDRTLVHWCGKAVGGNPLTVAFDNLGNESWSDECTIANHQRGGFLNDTRALLVSDIPTSATVVFPNVGSSATTLALVTVKGLAQSDRGIDNLTVSFRSVPISR